MIIEQLTLSNWLSYPDKWITNGEPQKPCFDFQSHPSYVIFGKNGAGKSSIMEAILFALFGNYARTLDYSGIKRQGINIDSAIRTGEDSTTVELVFSLNGERHKVHRILSQRSANKAFYSVWDEEKEDWSLKKSGITAVNENIASLIGMKRDLFCGTVVLEQGKAGRFMEIKPADQVEYVTNLLGLDIYTRYYEQAKKLGNDKKREAKRVEENELLPLADVSEEKVENAEQALIERQNLLDKSTVEVDKRTALFASVEVISGLRQRITGINNQIQTYDMQLAQKAEIETAVQIIKEWEQTKPKLGKVQDELKHFTTQQGRVTTLEQNLRKAQADYALAETTAAELEPQYKEAEKQRKAVENSLPELNKKHEKAKQQLGLIIAECKLNEREAKLHSLQNVRKERLADWAIVERDHNLRDELWRAGFELKEIIDLLQESELKLQKANKEAQTLVDRQKVWENRQNSWIKEQELIKTFATEVASQQENVSRLEQTLQTNRTLLERRKKAHGQSTCPTCGTTMEDEVLDRFHQELSNLSHLVDDGGKEWNEANKHTKGLAAQLITRQQEADTEKDTFTRESSKIDSEKRDLERRRAEINLDEQKAGERWQKLVLTLNYTTDIIVAPTKACLDHAREVSKTVKNADQVYSDLQKVQAQSDSAQEELERIKVQRKHPFETFTQVQQNEATELASKLATNIKDANDQLKIHQNSERDLGQQVAKTEQQILTLGQTIQTIQTETLPNENQLLETAEVAKGKAYSEFESSLAGLSWPLEMIDVLRETAVSNQPLSASLHAWLDSQRPLAQKQEALQQAIREIENLRTQQATLQAQIDNYPDEVQQTSVIHVTNLLEESKTKTKQYEQQLQKARENYWQEKQRLESKQKFEAQHKQLINELKHFQALTNLLAPPSGTSSGGALLRQVMHDALKEVATIASTTLEDWGQTTEVIVPEEALRFKILDRSSSTVERDYQLFSGGEKFMVALAMALAIGEVAGGTGQMDCLFIDEGFGLLDKDNRDVVAHEIVGNLVNRGRRRQVIVITHMEDIRSAFPDTAQLHLVNEGNATQLQSEGAYDPT